MERIFACATPLAAHETFVQTEDAQKNYLWMVSSLCYSFAKNKYSKLDSGFSKES
jgi:hypothetical protein